MEEKQKKQRKPRLKKNKIVKHIDKENMKIVYGKVIVEFDSDIDSDTEILEKSNLKNVVKDNGGL